MRKLQYIFGASILALNCSFGSGNIGGDEDALAPVIGADDPSAIPGEYIVVMHDRSDASLIDNAANLVSADINSEIRERFDVLPAFSARLSEKALEDIRKDPNVRYVEQDRVVSLSTVFNTSIDLDRTDQRTGRNGQYNDFGFNGAGVHVYVIDTGVRATHTEFTGRVSTGFTAINDGNGSNDCNGHGTHVSSTVLGTTFGMAKGAILHPVRVLGCNGSGSNSGIISGINFAINDCASRGARCVINMSLGGGASTATDNAITNAVNRNIPTVVAAGNENQNACNVSPARAPAAITVGAISDTDSRASFSNFGSCVDVFAPGTSVRGAWFNSNTATNTIDGTSMASPHVAGAVAQFLQRNPNASAAAVAGALLTSATPGCVTGANGSPNLILFNDFTKNGAGQGCGSNGGGSGGTLDSCSGRCGTATTGAACQCDAECVQFGDCCDDASQLCGVDTCTGRCGEFQQGADCQCDAQCAQFGDCCTDKANICQ
jgi:subtilisin family serine protease